MDNLPIVRIFTRPKNFTEHWNQLNNSGKIEEFQKKINRKTQITTTYLFESIKNIYYHEKNNVK